MNELYGYNYILCSLTDRPTDRISHIIDVHCITIKNQLSIFNRRQERQSVNLDSRSSSYALKQMSSVNRCLFLEAQLLSN